MDIITIYKTFQKMFTNPASKIWPCHFPSRPPWQRCTKTWKDTPKTLKRKIHTSNLWNDMLTSCSYYLSFMLSAHWWRLWRPNQFMPQTQRYASLRLIILDFARVQIRLLTNMLRKSSWFMSLWDHVKKLLYNLGKQVHMLFLHGSSTKIHTDKDDSLAAGM